MDVKTLNKILCALFLGGGLMFFVGLALFVTAFRPPWILGSNTYEQDVCLIETSLIQSNYLGSSASRAVFSVTVNGQTGRAATTGDNLEGARATNAEAMTDQQTFPIGSSTTCYNPT